MSAPAAALRAVRRHGPGWLLLQLGLTLLGLALLWMLGRLALAWVFGIARWEVVAVNLRLFTIGTYPAELAWRPALALAIVAALAGFGQQTGGRIARDLARLLGLALALLFALPFLAPLLAGVGNGQLSLLLAAFAGARSYLLGAIVALALGRAVGQVVVGRGGGVGADGEALRSAGPRPNAGAPLPEDAARARRRAARALRRAWFIGLILAILVLRGLGQDPEGGLRRVPAELWGGLLLTLSLATAAIALSFPLGLLLALGRRSRLPLVKGLSVAYIELIRGVPLVTVLYMVALLVPLVMPEGLRPGDVLRAVAGLSLFAAAYLAEDIRGGLAAVGGGQYEAARALGLGPITLYGRVVLPQALRVAIPAIVGQFISLFKDTSLVVILGLRELLGTARAVSNQPEFLGTFRETLVFIAVIYFAYSFAMSRSSRRLEAGLRGAEH